jgi:CPA1 family monovalent cation:H+ antiporter
VEELAGEIEHLRLLIRSAHAALAAGHVVDAQQTIERQLRGIALRAARDELYRLCRQRHIEDETLRRIVREIDFDEARYME